MVYHQANMILDYDLDLLKELVRIIDQHLEKIRNDATQVDDADSLGYFDSAEHVTGLGFVACQTYMASVYGHLRIEKQMALSIGSLHASGQTKAEIINHAANYWKHNNEWFLDKSEKQRKSIENTFASIGFPVDIDYPLSGVLTEIVSPESTAFKPVIDILMLWRNELSKVA